MHVSCGNILEAMENHQCISLNMHIMTHFLTGCDRCVLPSQTALVSVCVAFNLSTIWRTCERFPNHLSKAWPSSIYIWIWSIGMEDGNETNTPQHAKTIVLVPSYDSYCLSSGNEILALWVHSGLILGLRPANERRRYKVTPSPIGWAQT